MQLWPKEKVKCVREPIKCEGRDTGFRWKIKGTRAKEKNAEVKVGNKRCS